jgi:hypothetical protein
MVWKPGQSGNPKGRRPLIPALREYCKPKTVKQFEELDRIFYLKETPPWVKKEIAKLFAAYSHGHPVSLAAISLLDHRQAETAGGEVVVHVGFKSPQPLAEFANQKPEPAPLGTRQLEDLRPGRVADRRALLEEELRRNEAEIARLRAMQEQRLVDIEPTRTWPTDRQSGDGLGWPGRMGPR